MSTSGRDEFLDVRQTAALTGRSAETVRRWIWSGTLPVERRGRRLMLARSDLDAWLAARSGRGPATLAEWVEELGTAGRLGAGARRAGRGGASAADLVLEDRRDRSGLGRSRAGR